MGGPTCFALSKTTSQREAAGGGALEVLVHVLDHDDGRVHHRPDRDRDPAKAHDVGVHAHPAHDDERDEDADGQRHDYHERRSEVQQKQQRHGCDDERFLHKFLAEGGDGPVDEVAAVVGRSQPRAGRQCRVDLLKPLLHPLDRVERVRAEAHDDDAGHDFAATVEVRDAATGGGAFPHRSHVGDPNRGAIRRRPDGHVLDVGRSSEVSEAANHVFPPAHLQDARPDIDVVIPDRPGYPRHRDVEGAQPLRVHLDLVLLHEPAQARDLGHTRHGGQLISEVPVLEGAQFGEVQAVRFQGVLVNPSHAGRIRTERRFHVFRQLTSDPVQVFEHA